jgi:pyridoxamine 5'-phosphate oxidase
MGAPLDLPAVRREYAARGLRRAHLDPDPFQQFAIWFGEAVAAQVPDVNAMTLATAGADGAPAARIVLLKGSSARGFVFFTNYLSEKGRQLEQNPRAALVFFWVELERQIRIDGTVEKTSRAEAEAYFHSRPVGSQLGAWASRQSEVIASRAALEAQLAQVTEQYGSGGVPLPPHWGGYCVVPRTIEFWQGRPNRLHDRFRYTHQADASWLLDRLSP